MLKGKTSFKPIWSILIQPRVHRVHLMLDISIPFIFIESKNIQVGSNFPLITKTKMENIINEKNWENVWALPSFPPSPPLYYPQPSSFTQCSFYPLKSKWRLPRGLPNSTKSPRTRGKFTKMNREEVSLKLTWLGLVLNSYVRVGSRHTPYYYWIFAL